MNGTLLGGQNVRLSWGRTPSNKQVIFTEPCHSGLVWHQSLIPILFYDRAFVLRLSKIQPRVVTLLLVDITAMPRVVMRIMVTLLLLLDRIPMCMEVIQGILVTNTHSSNNSKWDIAKILLLQICDLCDSTVLMELLFPSRNKDSYPFPPLPHLIASNIGILPKALVSL